METTQLAPSFIVTGGCGFVGSNLVAQLQQRVPGCHVIVIDSMRTGTFQTLVDACQRCGEHFRGEVLAKGVGEVLWDWLLKEHKPRAVFHLGAITDTTVDDEAVMIEQNAGLAWRVIVSACAERDVPLVYASSAATYGTPGQALRKEPFPEDAAGRPNNVYGFSKWLMEQVHRRISAERVSLGEKQPWIIGLRFFNVFGPGESHKGSMASMAYQLTKQILAGGRPRLFEFGEQARDQVSVDDIVGICLASAGLGERGDPKPGIYNAGSGKVTSFEDVASAVRSGLGIAQAERPTEFIPMPASIRRFYQDYTCADMSLAASGLGFKPMHDPVEAIASYARWIADTEDGMSVE
ncbi:MAG TPA: NAD-dependent epimerase/dehydratase family protein [Phycisphaerales bacterium]|nr:NAD-dependent epimerase/dehydratase family protein [Phycisphaerales bacterium]